MDYWIRQYYNGKAVFSVETKQTLYFAAEFEKVSEKMLYYSFTDLLLCYHFIFSKLKP